MARKRYRDWALDQAYLLPPSLKDWLAPDHRVFRILEVVDELDLREIVEEIDSKDPRGTRPYHPRMMLALLIFAYSEGVYSSRKIARATQERVPFRVLAANQGPHFTVINAFRNRHRRALPGLFAQVVLLCRRLGLVDLAHVSIDGTKLQANASKHKAMSYGRMEKELAALEAEVERMLSRAEAEDAEEDVQYGEGHDRDELPAELKRREDRIARIREGMAALEREAREAKAADLRERAAALRDKATSEQDPVERKRKRTRAKSNEKRANELDPDGHKQEDPDPTRLPVHRIETTKQGNPTARAQYNFTDPESCIMCRDKAFLQGFNAQAAVDAKHQIIVGVGLSNQAPDQEYLVPLLERVKQLHGAAPQILTADAGYISTGNVDWCEEQRIDAYIATSRQSRRRAEPSSDGPKQWDRMAAKLKTAEGRKVYARRKTITEPVFGQIREARGFRRFSLRGRVKAEAEWTLLALVHDILKLVGATQPGLKPSPALA